MPRSRLRMTAIVSALALLALVLSHHLVYFMAHGAIYVPGGATQEPGHEQYWSGLSVLVAAAVAVLVGVAAVQVRRLALHAKAVQSHQITAPDDGLREYARMLRFLSWRIALVALAAFVFQENAEIAASGAAAPILDVFTRDSALALPALLLVSGMVAAVAALVGWHRHVLLARIRAAASRARRAAGAVHPPVAQLLPRLFLMSLAIGVRAPPAASA